MRIFSAGKKAIIRASGMLAALLMPAAHAAYTYDNCEFSDAGTITAHVVASFKDDAQRRDPLSDWIDLPHPHAWACTRYTDNPAKALEILLKTWIPPNPTLRATFDFEGGRYSLYQAASSGLGYIMTRRYSIQSDSGYQWTSPWLAVRNDNNNDIHAPSQTHHLALPHLARYTVSVENRVRLFKWGQAATSFPRTGVALDFQAAEQRYWTGAFGIAAPKGLPRRQEYAARLIRYSRFSRIRVWFNRDDKTCSTPSSEKTVYLPHVPKSAFTDDIGSIAGSTGFNLSLINCTATVEGIEYKLLPVRFQNSGHAPTALETHDWASAYANSILPLDSRSTASGVGIQILDGSGHPVSFDSSARMPVQGYEKGDASASIPLQAQYIKTAPAISAGTVHALMTVLYMYK